MDWTHSENLQAGVKLLWQLMVTVRCPNGDCVRTGSVFAILEHRLIRCRRREIRCVNLDCRVPVRWDRLYQHFVECHNFRTVANCPDRCALPQFQVAHSCYMIALGLARRVRSKEHLNYATGAVGTRVHAIEHKSGLHKSLLELLENEEAEIDAEDEVLLNGPIILVDDSMVGEDGNADTTGDSSVFINDTQEVVIPETPERASTPLFHITVPASIENVVQGRGVPMHDVYGDGSVMSSSWLSAFRMPARAARSLAQPALEG
jgi:hypothetical protein